MASIDELEPEYLSFIEKKNYGTPKVFAKPHEYEDLKAYCEGWYKILIFETFNASHLIHINDIN